MELNQYQTESRHTAIYHERQAIVYPTLGLTGEAGEVANKVKKILRDHEGQFTQEVKQDLALELGDCLWYVASLAFDLGYDLEDIALMNLAKLDHRARQCRLQGSGDPR